MKNGGREWERRPTRTELEPLFYSEIAMAASLSYFLSDFALFLSPLSIFSRFLL